MGASGYIGASLVKRLAHSDYRVRAAARSIARIPPASGVEAVRADVMERQAVADALSGADTAFYLVHTLGAGGDYADRDRMAATIFAEESANAGVKRIIYLGGLGEQAEVLSEHLASRQEVGRVLASTGVPLIEFRASIVIGSGSTSFEMIRNLTEKLPVMTTPRWVRMPAQPIAIDDVVAYLTTAIELELGPSERHRIYEVGGSEIVSYGDLLALFARARGLRRLVIPVPVLSPGLSGWWLYLFTPKQATVGRQLAESLRYPTVVGDDKAAADFPEITPIGATEAMRRAFAAEDAAFSAIRWAETFGIQTEPQHLEREGRYIDSRAMVVDCPPEAAFDPVACIGGDNGWYAYDTLWDVRGFIDLLLGGPGRRRGRRDPYALVEGDHLEWWVVEAIDPPWLLRLRAEMVLPGRGWLQYELMRDGDRTLVRQTALFDAKGVLGRAYWYAVVPFHHFVFNGTLRGIEVRCRELVEGPNSCPLPGEHARRTAERLDSPPGA
jgi:uncharacterized protein YbjT (DUF2867 family)